MKILTLKSLKAFLEAEGYDCSIEEATDKYPFEALAVRLVKDYKDRDQTLKMVLVDQLMPPTRGIPVLAEEGGATHCLLQFMVELPFPVQVVAVSDLARFLALTNRSADLPGFEMDEIEGKIFFRHVMIGKKDRIDRASILSIVGVITMLLGLFAPNIEKVAAGETTMNELLEEALETMKKMT